MHTGLHCTRTTKTCISSSSARPTPPLLSVHAGCTALGLHEPRFGPACRSMNMHAWNHRGGACEIARPLG